ncbi:MAG: ThuA domain-containing protein [Planctomycetota bacterium]
MLRAAALAVALAGVSTPAQAPDPFVTWRGNAGPGLGKTIVFVTGDEEYRSEESMPQLAQILAVRLGFTCTVLFAVDPKTGAIDPGVVDNIPGTGALAGADLMVVFTRFRDLPDAQMQPFVDYVESGRPIVGLRTATHAFDVVRHERWRRWSWRSGEWQGGFGRQVLGETWIAHHGEHGRQGTRGIVAEAATDHAILRGIASGDVWDPADVYAVRLPLPVGCSPLLLGEVLAGTQPDAPAAKAAAGRPDPNEPKMPVAWTRAYRAGNGKQARVFTTTIGSAQAFVREGTRRLLVNACLWCVGLEAAIRPDLDVRLVGDFAPGSFGFGGHKRGVLPADLLRARVARPK